MTHKAFKLPPPEVRAAPEPFTTEAEAETEREYILSEYPEHHPHLVVVEWEGVAECDVPVECVAPDDE